MPLPLASQPPLRRQARTTEGGTRSPAAGVTGREGTAGTQMHGVGMQMGPAARSGTPGPGSSRCHLLSRTRRAERRGGPGQAFPGVKRPLRAPVRRADRPSKVSMGSVPPPQPAGPGTASAKNRAELLVQASPSPAELRALRFPQLPQRGATPPGQPATFPPCPAEVETPTL